MKDMEKKQEYFGSVSVIKIIFMTFIIGLIFGLMFFFVKGVRAEDNETKKVIPEELDDSKDELPSQKPKESEEDSTTIFQG